MKLRLFADYHQVHVQDAAWQPLEPDAWADIWNSRACEDRLATGDDFALLRTERIETVTVDVQVLQVEPQSDLESWDHVTSSSIRVSSGQLVLMGCTDYSPEAPRIELVPGAWRMRASHKRLVKPPETIRLQFWPAEYADARVEKSFVPPPVKASKRIVTAKNAKQAAALARQGETDKALGVLLSLSAKGDAAAAASAAELLAFRGRWDEFVPQAMQLLADPSAVYAGNVFCDMAQLLRRAAREIGDPTLIERAAETVPSEFGGMRDAVLLRDSISPSAEPGPAQLEQFRAAVLEAEQGKRFAGFPQELAAHCLALALGCKVEEEAIARFDAAWASFDNAVDVGRLLARHNRTEQAWSVIRDKRADWYPLDHAQVAPVVLLLDPWLSPLMTVERCEEILSTPRGHESQSVRTTLPRGSAGT